MRRLLPALLVSVVPFTASCYVLAGAGIGYVVSQQVLPNSVHESQVADDYEVVWESVQETTEILTDLGVDPTVTQYPRRIQTEVNSSTVTIDVEAVDLDLTLIRVSAEKVLGADAATAEQVMSKILERLEA